MLTRLQLSLKLLKEATEKFLFNINEAKKQERVIIKELNDKKDAEKITEIKSKLGI